MQDVYTILVVTGAPIPGEDRGEIKAVFDFNSVILAEYVETLNKEAFEHTFNVSAVLNVNAKYFEAEIRRAKRKLSGGIKTFYRQPILIECGVENIKVACQALGEAMIMGGLMLIVSHRNVLYRGQIASFLIAVLNTLS